MLTFLRRVRKGLFESDMSRHYVLYALGEIALVVIGILIALQINNWNEDRKLQKEASDYRYKLINDLAADTLNINHHIEEAILFREGILEYFDYFDQEDYNLELLIDSARNVRAPYRVGRYLPVNFTFLEMQSSGKLGLLSETQHRALIELSNFQDFIKIVFAKAIEGAQTQRDKASDYWGSDFNNIDFHKKLGISQNQDQLIQGLLHRHKQLSMMYGLYGGVIERGRELKRISRDAINSLDIELKQH